MRPPYVSSNVVAEMLMSARDIGMIIVKQPVNSITTSSAQ